ncbi:MAG: hypothetical protein ACXQTZ_00425 [Candidatus Alkanophagales archaeon]
MSEEVLRGDAELRIRRYDGEFFVDLGWHSFPLAPEDVEMLLNVVTMIVYRRLREVER